MRIVVAGGTGFIGREVVDSLLETGADEIVVTSRDPDRGDVWGGRVRLVQAFAGDALSLGRAFTQADVVVQCLHFSDTFRPAMRRAKMSSDIDISVRQRWHLIKCGMRVPSVRSHHGTIEVIV